VLRVLAEALLIRDEWNLRRDGRNHEMTHVSVLPLEEVIRSILLFLIEDSKIMLLP